MGAPTYSERMETANETASTPRARRRRLCPVCRSEAWRIAYGMIMPNEQATMPNTVFAGCCIQMRERRNPKTAEREVGTPTWQCQNPSCGHEWW